MATIVSAAQEWLKSDNRICSAIMKERVSNQTMLHYAHVGVPAMLGLCCMNVVAPQLSSPGALQLTSWRRKEAAHEVLHQ